MSFLLFLLRVIPATKIPLPAPQILTYFSARELPIGSLVSVPIHKRKATGVVIGCERIDKQKMALRKAEFELRGINKIIADKPIISEQQLRLADWISQYYWTPLGAVLKLMIPPPATLREVLRAGNLNHRKNQRLILAPEISLIENVAKENKITDFATLHSGQTDKQYYENWLKIKTNEAKIIIATRMALFAPFVNLTEIIVENEHNDLYKSRQTPRYHARETALKLAEIWNAKITLKSATPSIETSWLAENKKIILNQIRFLNEKNSLSSPPLLAKEGVGGRLRYTNSVIDLRAELKEKNFSIFSRVLQEKVKTTLAKKQQIILFINRRGSSTSLLCRDCGFVPRCPNCDVPFVYHLSPAQFICHHCGHSELPPILCPQCFGTRIKFFGTGTQKVEAEFKKLFPDAIIARLDSDIVSVSAIPASSSVIPAPPSVIPAPPSVIPAQAGIHADKIIADFNSQKIQVLISTQIIFNKELNKAPLVALMLADTLLHLPDFRSNERTFQIISQLKNLSDKDFILQTYSPENYAIQNAIKDDYKSFYEEEISARRELGYPPFSQLIKLTYQHKNAKKAEQEAKILTEKLKQQIANQLKTNKLITNQLIVNGTFNISGNLPVITILGPSPAFIPKIKGKYIWQIVLKTKIADLKLRNKILSIIPPDWIIDIDPLQII